MNNNKKKTRLNKFHILSLLLIFILGISCLNACAPENKAPSNHSDTPVSETHTNELHESSLNTTLESGTRLKTQKESASITESSESPSMGRQETETDHAFSEYLTSESETTLSSTQKSTAKAQSSSVTTTSTVKATSEEAAVTTTGETTTSRVSTTSTINGNITVYLTINCLNAVNAKIAAAEAYAPHGVMLSEQQISLKAGSTAYDVLKESAYLINAGNNFLGTYISAIQGIQEGAAGAGMGGWIYSVNGEFPLISSSKFIVENGDRVSFHYTVKNGDVPGSLF